MARIERIQRRLENWALWTERQSSGGLGYATRSVLLSDIWARGSYNGMIIPVLEQEAAETDMAVQSFRLSQSHLYQVLVCIYLRDLGIRATAARMGRAESTIKANLDQADHVIDRWLADRATAAQRIATQKNQANSFTS